LTNITSPVSWCCSLLSFVCYLERFQIDSDSSYSQSIIFGTPYFVYPKDVSLLCLEWWFADVLCNSPIFGFFDNMAEVFGVIFS
jgi:hypothetical protein